MSGSLKIYEAEEACGLIDYDHAEADPGFESVGECQSYVDRVVASKWWKARSRTDSIAVRDGRRRRSAAAFGYAGLRIAHIALPRKLRQEAMILHELAHIMARKGAGHNREFRYWYVQLVTSFMGRESGKALREGLDAWNLKYRSLGRCWHCDKPVFIRKRELCAGCHRTPWIRNRVKELMGRIEG